MARKAVKGTSKNPTIRITKPAKDRLIDWLDANRKPDQGLTVAQIIWWFTRQNPVVQRVVLNEVPDRLDEAYANALRKIADELDPPGAGMKIGIAAMDHPDKPKK